MIAACRRVLLWPSKEKVEVGGKLHDQVFNERGAGNLQRRVKGRGKEREERENVSWNILPKRAAMTICKHFHYCSNPQANHKALASDRSDGFARQFGARGRLL